MENMFCMYDANLATKGVQEATATFKGKGLADAGYKFDVDYNSLLTDWL